MIKSKAELSREIEKKASTYTDEELFSSPYFYEHLQSTIDAVCNKLDRVPFIDAFCDAKNNLTACTEGNYIEINTLGPLIREMPTNWEKYVNIFGHITHECGHVLFTDFKQLNPLRMAWNDKDFYFYPSTPDVEGAEDFANYLKTHPNYRMIFVHEMMDIANIIEDVYIENRIYEHFDGLCSAGLHKTNDEKYRLAPTEEELIAMILAGQQTPLSVAKCIMQLRKLGYNNKMMGMELPEQVQMIKDFIYEGLAEVDEELDQLAWEQDGLKRCELLNKVFVKLRPLLPEPDDNQDYQNGDSDNSQEGEGDGQESNDYSKEQAQNLNSNSDNASKKSGMSQQAKGDSSPVNSGKPDKEKAEENKEHSKELSDSKDALKDEFKKAQKQIAKAEVQTQDEEEHQKELQKEADKINDDASNQRGFDMFDGFKIVRQSTNDMGYYKSTYPSLFRSVERTSTNLVRKIRNILKDRDYESLESGLLMGTKFNARDVYRNDGKYFSRINEPDGDIRVAFGVLVDESGSMGERKSSVARNAAILLENTLRNLGVPLLLVGHTSEYGECKLFPYVDFDTNDDCDKYRLCGIRARSGNIDGAAITYVGEKLLKRPEQIKVMIVISDGLPAGVSFYDEFDRNNDTKLAIAKYRKKGIKVFGAIVDSVELVQNIYSPEYSFDCTSNLALEQQLVKLIKKYCLIK